MAVVVFIFARMFIYTAFFRFGWLIRNGQRKIQEFRLNEQRVSLAGAPFEQLEIGSTRLAHRETQNRAIVGGLQLKKSDH